MSKHLRHFLYEHYSGNSVSSSRRVRKDYHIQIDDQDDSDILNEFCAIFVTVGEKNRMEIELCGGIPITRELADFCEIYGGFADPSKNRIIMHINPGQIEALTDLAARIKNTSELGYTVQNPDWDKISSRTVSSIYRFVRIMKEYREMRTAGLI